MLVAPDSKVPVTVVIPTLDEADSIAACIESVRWAAEVVVVDGGSSDETAAIAASLGARILTATGTTIGGQRNIGVADARHDWILALDADEKAGGSLEASVASAILGGSKAVYSIARRNRFMGRVMRWGGWGNDRVERLFPASERFDDRRVHERLASRLPVARLPGTIDHEPYRDIAEYRVKLDRYSVWGAAELGSRGRLYLWFSGLVRPPLRVFRMLVWQLGLLDGPAGVRLALLSGLSVREKYRRAREPGRAH